MSSFIFILFSLSLPSTHLHILRNRHKCPTYIKITFVVCTSILPTRVGTITTKQCNLNGKYSIFFFLENGNSASIVER